MIPLCRALLLIFLCGVTPMALASEALYYFTLFGLTAILQMLGMLGLGLVLAFWRAPQDKLQYTMIFAGIQLVSLLAVFFGNVFFSFSGDDQNVFVTFTLIGSALAAEWLINRRQRLQKATRPIAPDAAVPPPA